MIRYGFHTDEMMVCLILNGDKIPAEKALVESLCEIPEMTSITINVNKKRNNVILGDQLRLLWGQSYITDSIGDISYQISPLSFFPGQSHPDRKTVWKGSGVRRPYGK